MDLVLIACWRTEAAWWWSPRRVQLSAGVSAGVAAVVMQHSCEVHPAFACTLLDTESVAGSDDFAFEHAWLLLLKGKHQFSGKKTKNSSQSDQLKIFVFESQDKVILFFFSKVLQAVILIEWYLTRLTWTWPHLSESHSHTDRNQRFLTQSLYGNIFYAVKLTCRLGFQTTEFCRSLWNIIYCTACRL